MLLDSDDGEGAVFCAEERTGRARGCRGSGGSRTRLCFVGDGF